MKKTKTYMDKLMENKEFREKFDKEYLNLCIGEHIARIRHQANLTQDALAKRTHTTKSCLLYTSPSPRDLSTSRMPSSA